MSTEMNDDNKRLFNIEGFFRTRCSFKEVLELDDIILRNDIDDSKKMAMVNQLVSDKVEAIKGEGRNNER